jgi:hypothetical protein|nr:hypothetical protein [Nanoarchaeum sp.]
MKINKITRKWMIIGTIGCVVGGAYGLGDNITRLIDKYPLMPGAYEQVRTYETPLHPFGTFIPSYSVESLDGTLEKDKLDITNRHTYSMAEDNTAVRVNEYEK